MGIGELKPTQVTLKLADRTNIHPVGFIEDIPVEAGGIYIPTDFVVLDMDEDNQVPILLGRPFLATSGAIVDVKGGRIAFRVSDEMVGFGMETFNKEPFDFSCCMIDDHSVKERFLVSSTQYDFLVSSTQYDFSNRQANDSKRALRGRQPTHLIAFILFVFCCFVGNCPSMIQRNEKKLSLGRLVAWHDQCLKWHGRATLCKTNPPCQEGWHGPCLYWHDRARFLCSLKPKFSLLLPSFNHHNFSLTQTSL